MKHNYSYPEYNMKVTILLKKMLQKIGIFTGMYMSDKTL